MADAKEKSVFAKLKILISPTAVGVYITLFLSLTAWQYYLHRDEIKKYGAAMKAINIVDDISVDYRLKFRGLRTATPDVAVLAVDDRSVEIVGRWPWPRDKIGRAIDNAFKYGAKVIATDIVWSEPSDRPDQRLIDGLNEKVHFPSETKKVIDENLAASDPDKIFSQYIEKNKSKLVLGNFYSSPTEWQDSYTEAGYQSICHDLVFKNSALSKMIDSQSVPFVALDSRQSPLPNEIADIYQVNLSQIEDKIKEKTPPGQNLFDKYQSEKTVTEAKIDFCKTKFLDPQKDETAQTLQASWKDLKDNMKGLEGSSFDEWAEKFKSFNPLNAVTESTDWTLTFPLLASKAENFGYFNAVLDNDGSIRRSQLLARAGSNYMPSIALEAYLLATGFHLEMKMDSVSKIFGKGIVSLAVENNDGDTQFIIPVTADGKLAINYAGPQHAIPHASIADLLNENDPNIQITKKVYHDGELKDDGLIVPKSEFFKNKILVLGATAIGVYDLRVTPFDENFPGVETHANVIDNLIRRDFLHHNSHEDQYMPLLMLLLGLALTMLLAHTGAVSGMGFTILTCAAITLVDKYLLFSKGTLVSIALPLVQTVFTYMALTFYKYFTEERSKKELRATFSKYVSPAIVEEILKDPKNLELGGKKERITVFFSDVRGFTTISEKLDPRALSDLLNSYLTPMTDIVFKNQGTLDKYMGDAVMAFFGAPIHYNDHAKQACRCALESLEKLKDLQAMYEKKKLPMIDIGIGLNTGECSVGNMGSQTVRSYTVMGDSVNLASRLEGINKTYGTHIIISEFTYADVKDDFLCREVDWVRVKGKLKPVKIFELMAEGKGSEILQDTAKHFNAGYEHYHQKRFDQAIKQFSQSVAKNPDDETAKIYIERCQEFISEPPPGEWDGVYVMKTK